VRIFLIFLKQRRQLGHIARPRHRRAHEATPHRDTRERDGSRVPFTEEQLTAMRGGQTAEEYRWKLFRGEG